MGGSEGPGGVAALPEDPGPPGDARAASVGPSPPPSPEAGDADEAWRLFEAGDFRAARERARAILARDPPPSEAARERARAILDGIRPDPAALWVLGGCVALLGLVIGLTLF